jgi:hypothetical protein
MGRRRGGRKQEASAIVTKTKSKPATSVAKKKTASPKTKKSAAEK